MPIAIAGRDATILVNHLDGSPYLNEYEIEAEADDIEVTRFGAVDKEYLSGPRENTVTLSGHWTGDDGMLDEELDETFGVAGDQVITICPRGAVDGVACYLTPATQVSYSVSAEADDITEAEAEFRASRVARARILHPIDVAATVTGNGTAVVASAATAKGASAHLHVLEVLGAPTSVAIVVEGSTDGTTWAPLMTFTTITTATGYQRAATSSTATIPVQMRVKHTITGGTSPSVKYVVAVARHLR